MQKREKFRKQTTSHENQNLFTEAVNVVYFLLLQKAIGLCNINQRDELQDWRSQLQSFNYIRSAIFHYFGSTQITFFNCPRLFMVTFQCQLDRAINANSAEPVTSCPFFQTWLNEPELDNPVHCQRFMSDKCTLSFKTFH